ncbi:hypothetical protein J7T55_012723 [Diaporthe amygdali]|uniref:uncharacterized protein n=1 Tax=Phomopsis amygdali TaxID=1214568 RepID=UPI0022FED11F|nr:uncharacterized protein J7T55_012723 [Diaporthe amygdali]KAJ0115443.1 hypothetical protein J7T55_012723 [Diaporthe amygdali]
MMLLMVLLSTIAVVASLGLPATNAAMSSSSPYPFPLEQIDANTASPNSITVRGNEMKVGSPCHGVEGQWYCMTQTFQRCASGQWSVVMDTSWGTVCEPAGFSYDFQPAFASWFPPADSTQTITCIATATATGGPTVAPGTGTSDAARAGKAAPRSAARALVFGLASAISWLLVM